MRRSFPTALLASLLICSAPPALAANIYKWVDENGKTHFGDRPPATAEQAEEIKIRDIPAEQRQVPSNAERRARQDYLLRSFEKDRAEKKQAAAKNKALKKRHDQQCAVLKRKLKLMRQSNYIYHLDANGKKVIRPNEERENAIGQLANAISKNCR